MDFYGRVFRTALVRVNALAAIAALATTSACSSSNAGLAAGSGGTDASADANKGTDAGSAAGEAGASVTDAGASGAEASADGGASIVVTSPAFANSQAIPVVNTCAGANTSPEIDWTAGPSTAQSYAVVVSDLTATANIHWVVWDIPIGTQSLMAMLAGTPTLTSPAGAKQVDLRTSPDAGTAMNGFFGPCPRGALHSYEFAVHALDVATLPGVSTTSRSADVKAIVLMHSLAHGILTGTSNAAPPDAGTAVDAGDQ